MPATPATRCTDHTKQTANVTTRESFTLRCEKEQGHTGRARYARRDLAEFNRVQNGHEANAVTPEE